VSVPGSDSSEVHPAPKLVDRRGFPLRARRPIRDVWHNIDMKAALLLYLLINCVTVSPASVQPATVISSTATITITASAVTSSDLVLQSLTAARRKTVECGQALKSSKDILQSSYNFPSNCIHLWSLKYRGIYARC
jgi:hypothetical protein